VSLAADMALKKKLYEEETVMLSTLLQMFLTGLEGAAFFGLQ
jgi:hypothetical protein